MRSIAIKNNDEELQNRLRQLAQNVMFEISALDPSRSKELLGTFVSELFLSVAEEERQEVRRQRQAEGIAAAKARGVRFGPEPKPLPENFDECCEAWRDGQITAVEAAARCGLSRKSFYRAAKRKEQMAGCGI